MKDFLKIGSKFTKEQLEAEQRLLAGLQKQRELIPSQYPGLAERDPGRYAAIISDKDLEIAKQKMNDLNAVDLEQAVKIIAGSARSMGIEVKE